MRSIVRHAYSTVPYYRETMDRLGLTPADLGTAADLAKLPILEPWQLTRDPEYFVSTGGAGIRIHGPAHERDQRPPPVYLLRP